jgi:hypothetical protein
VSVTDACISMAQTVPVLQELAAAVARRRPNAQRHKRGRAVPTCLTG